MLTRLTVSGFKNLIDVTVTFGPFTCVAGPNATGKSNLFDAIHFLSLLADRPLLEAAMTVREEGGRSADVRSLFHRVGDRHTEKMRFVAEMIVPTSGRDSLGQLAEATTTYLRYTLELTHRGEARVGPNTLEITREELTHIKMTDAPRRLGFVHTPAWRRSVIKGRRTAPYITTVGSDQSRLIRLHQDGGRSGRPLERSAGDLPRTVISAVNAAESPTALLAKNEMSSWRRLQLEPSALRKPDEFTSPVHLGMDGAHAAATLHNMATTAAQLTLEADSALQLADEDTIYAEISNRLAELLDDVRRVEVHIDDQRELLTLRVLVRDGTAHDARALSDGTLRFLALAILEMERDTAGLICLEEPENGIHPARVPAMLRLLEDIATDTAVPAGELNPLRQVIVNTHSPVVVSHVAHSSLLVSRLVVGPNPLGDGRSTFVTFDYLAGTWRESLDKREARKPSLVTLGRLLDYLNPAKIALDDEVLVNLDPASESKRRRRRELLVAEREDVQLMMPMR